MLFWPMVSGKMQVIPKYNVHLILRYVGMVVQQ
jgi:hypothetical protein